MKSITKKLWFRPALGVSLVVLALVQLACIETPLPTPTPTLIFPINYRVDDYIYISPAKASDLSHPYIKGKIVFVDRTGEDNGMFAPRTFDLSVIDDIKRDAPELVATNPDQVGTIIWADCKETPSGSYYNGMTAYYTECTVTLIDKAENLIVGEKNFGAPPPDSINCPVNGSCWVSFGYGPFPSWGIAIYIKALPRK